MKKSKIHQQAAVGSTPGVNFMDYFFNTMRSVVKWRSYNTYIAKREKNICWTHKSPDKMHFLYLTNAAHKLKLLQ